jgi:hypothetical protein
LTTPGDTSMVTRKEVEKTFGGGGARGALISIISN